MNLLHIFTTLLLINNLLAANTFNKVMVDDAEALCLDGTKGAYYVHEGK